MRQWVFHSILVLCSLGLMPLGRVARGAEASFDDLFNGPGQPDNFGGVLGKVFTDGGINFTNPEALNGPGTFCISNETTDNRFSGLPGHSAPNVMSLISPSPGIGVFKSFDFSTGTDASFTSLTAFTANLGAGGLITLEGFLDGSLAGITTHQVPKAFIDTITLSLTGTFDSFEVYSSGTYNDGYDLANFDNVIVTEIPEPGSASLIVLCAAGLLSRRRRTRSPLALAC
jgi:hypothetical protein